jgi:Domain of unknown function (DUF4328)
VTINYLHLECNFLGRAVNGPRPATGKRGSAEPTSWLLFGGIHRRSTMSEFPAYQTAPQHSGLVPSLVPSLRVRSVIVIVAVALSTLASVATLGVPLMHTDIHTVQVVVGANLALTPVAGIAWMFWEYRARLNLRGFGVHNLQWVPGWTIGGWFIPLANLVLPILILNEIDKATAERAAAAAESGIGWSGRDSGRPIFVLWAVTWPLHSLAGYGAVALGTDYATVGLGLGIIVYLAAGVAATLLVLRITNGQETIRNSRPAELIATSPAPPPAPVVWPDAAV